MVGELSVNSICRMYARHLVGHISHICREARLVLVELWILILDSQLLRVLSVQL